MKKLTVLLFTVFAFLHSIKAQLNVFEMYDMFTPLCSPVRTWISDESYLPGRLAMDRYWITQTDYLTTNLVITNDADGVSSTELFNCHGYAWILTEDGPPRWIINDFDSGIEPYSDIFITDGSYTEVDSIPWPYPAKVYWWGCDHSGVTTETEGRIISKWGNGPLMEHAVHDHRYGGYNAKPYMKFYVKALKINSTTNIVGNTAVTFSLSASPTCSVVWDVTGPFGFSHPQPSNSSVNVKYIGSHGNDRSGVLTASVNGMIVAEKEITLQSPEISGNGTGVCIDGRTFTLIYPPIPSIVTWTVPLSGSFSFTHPSDPNGPLYTTNTFYNQVTVYRKETGSGNATLTASFAGGSAAMTLTPCVVPSITGDSTVCYNGNLFTLNNSPSNTITWTVSSPFSFNPHGNAVTLSTTTNNSNHQVTVYRTGSSAVSDSVTLSAYANINKPAIARFPITPCAPIIINGDPTVCTQVTYSISSGDSATWTIPNGFSANTLYGSSIVVTANNLYGASGTLKAAVNGVTFTKTIGSCDLSSIEISGPERFCSTGTYTIPALPSNFTGSVAWTVKRTMYPYVYYVEYYTTHSIMLTVNNWEPEIFEITAVVKDENGTILNTCNYDAYGGMLGLLTGELYWTTASGQSGYLGISVYDKIYFTPWGTSDTVYIHSYTTNNGTVHYPTVRYSNAYFWSGCYSALVDVSIFPPNQLYITVPPDCEGCEGEIWINFYDDCGYGEDFYIPFEVLMPSPSPSPSPPPPPPPSPYLAYPNPVSDFL